MVNVTSFPDLAFKWQLSSAHIETLKSAMNREKGSRGLYHMIEFIGFPLLQGSSGCFKQIDLYQDEK